MAWTASGPVSTPGKGTTYVVAFLIGLTAIGGAVLGFRASSRDTSRATAGAGVDDVQGLDDAQPARPIVDITPMTAAPPAATNAAPTNALAATNSVHRTDVADDSNAIALHTAAVQREQSQSSTAPADLDQQNTSPTERPQAPAKPTTDEEPAQQTPAPAHSDVPF